ncbi:hypothetical protein K469DRAFT_741659 [Zopfia rhizophila CBS 207.26]|uniref:gamma-glutamylcyclotransferase n=1 Tax=Zopfia rhizophila CBS 207.26 TaxID=1314779 RepID=A0A6A6DI74_9PEZI|nr:hypothetical protein K469DRAFT_741659 [Zopfia rhizophila CBS 207.26]
MRDAYPKSVTVWYFAYGSNMSSAKFTGSRGIIPIDYARVCIPNWMLRMEIPGVPYSEPSFSSIIPRDDSDVESENTPDVIGVAYLITEKQYRDVIASEGGGIAYSDIAIRAEPVTEKDAAKTGPSPVVRTLASTSIVRRPPPKPSQRYMNLLTVGAEEAQIPLSYQKYLASIIPYEPPKSRWTKFGAFIFLSIWGPVMGLMEKITKASIGKDGNAPLYVVWLVRITVFIIWAVHDWIFAPIFGRGDGLRALERKEQRVDQEKLTEKSFCDKDSHITYGTL